MIIILPSLVSELALKAIETKDSQVMDILHDLLVELGANSDQYIMRGLRDRDICCWDSLAVRAFAHTWKCYDTIYNVFLSTEEADQWYNEPRMSLGEFS